ncbi:hypothetical protein RRG08_058392 [Elysia crispata]|uniref:Uncharacterized protein n=1 Tax=Elysia crispata TaxID=231223 RepID=A0AAE0XX45_9GAST|nr:hypothetical protein RRG08_058392 [Elysia crispata]
MGLLVEYHVEFNDHIKTSISGLVVKFWTWGLVFIGFRFSKRPRFRPDTNGYPLDPGMKVYNLKSKLCHYYDKTST